MSNIAGALLGALLLCVIDYMCFRKESKRWSGFPKKLECKKSDYLLQFL